MKAISLWPPYGSLIVAGVKKIETRSCRTSYRGRIAVHHTQCIPPAVWRHMEASSWFSDMVRDVSDGKDIPVGCVVGTVEIVGCEQIDDYFSLDLGVTESGLGNYAHGRWAWTLANPVKFDKPIPAKGKQGFWEWNP